MYPHHSGAPVPPGFPPAPPQSNSGARPVLPPKLLTRTAVGYTAIVLGALSTLSLLGGLTAFVLPAVGVFSALLLWSLRPASSTAPPQLQYAPPVTYAPAPAAPLPYRPAPAYIPTPASPIPPTAAEITAPLEPIRVVREDADTSAPESAPTSVSADTESSADKDSQQAQSV
jgi:hypothetical protein